MHESLSPVDDAEATAALRGFWVNEPTIARRMGTLIGLGSHAYLYGGIVAIEYACHGRTWMLKATAIAAFATSAAVFSALSWWMLRGLTEVRTPGRTKPAPAPEPRNAPDRPAVSEGHR